MKINILFKTIGVIILSVFLSSGMQAQSMFTDYEVLINDTLNSEPIFGVSEIIVFHPNHGSLELNKEPVGQFDFQYIPSEDFVGKDTFTIEYYTDYRGDLKYLHAIVTVDESLVYGQNDFVVIEKNSDFTFIDVLSNDTGTEGSLEIRAFPYRNRVYTDVSNTLDSVFIKPEKNYSGQAQFIYQICDGNNTCDEVRVDILVIDTDAQVNSDTLNLQTQENTAINFYLSDTTFNLIQSPSIGQVEEGYYGYMNTYTPFQNVDGRDTLIYADADGVDVMVVINIIKQLKLNTFVVDDYIYTYPGDTVWFDVYANDIVRNGIMRSHSNPDKGDLTHLKDGEFVYVAPEDPGLYSFNYQACVLMSNCEIGNVEIYVGTLAPEGLYRYNLSTVKNRPFVINYDVPLSNFNFDITQAPLNGVLEIHEGIDTLKIGCDDVIGYNLVTYTPHEDFVGSDLFELEFCASRYDLCQTVKVEMNVLDVVLDSAACICISDCVWPGDMDADGKVDMLDLLTFGWHLGDRGAERPFADKHGWHAQYSPDWDRKSITGANLKHLDSDGNGLIEQNDIDAIAEFFNKRNDLVPESRPSIKEYPVNLVYKGEPNPQVGDYVEFDVYVGNADFPAAYLHGLSLRYDVDPQTVDTSTLELRFKPNSFLTYDAMTAGLTINNGRTVNAGITRIDKLSPTGFGAVATLGFIIEDDLDGVRTDKRIPIRINMKESHIMDGTGKVYRLQDAEYELMVSLEKENSSQRLSIFPNPASSGQQIQARFNPVKTDAIIAIYSMDGKLMHEEKIMEGTYRMEYNRPLSSGVYIMTIRENGLMATGKFIVGP